MQHHAVHAAIIAHLRQQPIAEQLAGWDDDHLRRQMFANYRDQRGLRLTQFGQQVMQSCFQNYEFSIEHALRPTQLLFLDGHSMMPYFVTATALVLYDPLFAVRLRLVDGHVATLMEVFS